MLDVLLSQNCGYFQSDFVYSGFSVHCCCVNYYQCIQLKLSKYAESIGNSKVEDGAKHMPCLQHGIAEERPEEKPKDPISHLKCLVHFAQEEL